MENKERYEVFGNSLMVADNESDSIRNVFGFYECVDLLNEQSIRIKELEAEVVYQKNYVREEWKTQNNFLNENKQLKQQLEEKDNRIKELEQQCLDLKEDNDATTISLYACRNDLDKIKCKFWALEKENKQLKQSQKQLALEKLEKIKNFFDDSDDDKYADSEGWTITNRTVVEYVDNQIKELRKEQ